MLFEIVLIIIISFIIILFCFWILRIIYNQKINQIWKSLEISSEGKTFSKELVSDLPPPVQRYFLHSIKTDTPLASSVQLSMNGTIKIAPDSDPIPMIAKEILSTPKGFIWKAKVGRKFFKIIGSDYYTRKIGEMRWFYQGIIPIINSKGPDISQSAAGRLAIETLWLPSALLPQKNVKWEGVDENSAKITLKIDDQNYNLTFHFASDGKLQKVLMLRWGNKTEDGNYTYIPFGVEIKEESTFGGYTIPSHIRAGWRINDEKHPYADVFFNAIIENAEFR